LAEEINNYYRQFRRQKMHLSSITNNYLRIANPFMPMWWALAMPGTGHIMLGKMIKGFLLFGFEFFINTQSHLNLSIVYSLTGQFELAKNVIEVRWFFVYIGVYIFNVWDAYRLTTEINQLSALAVRERGPIRAFNLSFIEINYLNKINPWIGVFWTLVTPGIGHIMSRNIIPGFYLLVWHIIVVYQSRLNEGVLYSLTGQFQKAIDVMNMEWSLFIPSVYMFAVCDYYYRAVESNEIFKMEQARYLEKNYNSHEPGSFLKGWG
jgi:hypothetical protein